MRGKVKSFKEILVLARKARKSGKKIVTSNGCFDILHVGHIRNLIKAKSLGDVLIIGINSDRSVKLNKGKARPIIKEEERAETLAALESVDYVFIFNEKTPNEWLAELKPDVHVKGADRKLSEIVEKDTIAKFGGELVLIPFVKDRSTTRIIKKINKLYS